MPPTKIKKNIDTIEDLNAHLHRQEDRLEQLEQNAKGDTSRTDIQRIERSMAAMKGREKMNIREPTTHDDRQACAGIGEVIKAAARGETQKMEDLGGQKGLIHQKADLGTPITGADGATAFIVPIQFYRDVMRIVETESEFMPLVSRWEMSSKSTRYPRKNAGISLTKVSTDGDALTEQTPTWTPDTLTNYTYAAWVPFTEELLEDNDVNLGSYFRDLFGEAAATTFDTELLTSASAPTGLLNNTDCQSISMGAGSTGFADVTIQDMRDMEKELAETKGALKGARYMYSPYIHQILRDELNAVGDPLLASWVDAAPRKINGKSVALSYEMPDSSDDAADTAFAALGDPRQLVWGERLAIEIKLYDATSYSLQYAELFMRCRVRWAFDVGVPTAFCLLKTAAA